MSTEIASSPAPENGGNSYVRLSIEEQLKMIGVAIQNTVDNVDIQAALAKRGYDSVAMGEAKLLLQGANKFYISQKDKYGNKYGAKDDFDQLKEEIEDEYTDHIALARVALKNNRGELEKLQLNSRREKSISGWLSQAKTFYKNAIDSATIKAALLKKGITEVEMKAVLDKIGSLEQKEANKFSTRGDAQNATADRNNAIDELTDWYRDFRDTAKVALKKTPQLLENLGIIAKD